MTTTSTRVKRPIWLDATILLLSGVLFISMVSLGNWQVRRLGEKLDLITRVEAFAYGDPVAAPLSGAPPEYLRVYLTGRFDHAKSIQIKAVTDLGPGQWVMTPLLTERGYVWVNRGFVPQDLDETGWTKPDNQQTITGLVRNDQPDGTLLESNLPDQARWVSADLALMSGHVGIKNAVTYFVATDHLGDAQSWPRGGLTRLKFSNSHLSYALTWYAMAVLFAAAILWVIWDRKRRSE